ncbi:hypothetical protein M1367_03485 [Candidatus Marsarchaeota archaeon]|nr:hypothetical protein [Candidatus Marsarchaeota archaeon]
MYFHAKRATHAYNVHKVIWSGIFATYLLAAIEAPFVCGTGTSIIGVSIASILFVCIGFDLFRSPIKGAKPPSQILRIPALGFLGAMLFAYLMSSIVHLSGLALFILILYFWDRQFRKEFTTVLEFIVGKIGGIRNKKFDIR